MLLVFTLAMDFTTPQSFEGSICSHAITLKLCGASDSSGSAAKVVFRNSRAAGGPKVRPLTPVLFFWKDNVRADDQCNQRVEVLI
jgi:hypothetical protein